MNLLARSADAVFLTVGWVTARDSLLPLAICAGSIGRPTRRGTRWPYGETAVVTGLALVTDNLRGQARRLRFRYTHVWVKRDGRWRVVSRQATTVAE